MVDLFRVMKELAKNIKNKEIENDKKIFWKKRQNDFQMECLNAKILNAIKNMMEIMEVEGFVQSHVENHIQLSKIIL